MNNSNNFCQDSVNFGVLFNADQSGLLAIIHFDYTYGCVMSIDKVIPSHTTKWNYSNE